MSEPTTDRFFLVSALDQTMGPKGPGPRYAGFWVTAKLLEVELKGASVWVIQDIGDARANVASIGREIIEVSADDPRALVLLEASRCRLLLRGTPGEGGGLDLCIHTHEVRVPAVKHPEVKIATSDTSIIGAIVQRKEEHPDDPGWWRFGRPVWVPEHLVPEASDEVRWTWGNRNDALEAAAAWEREHLKTIGSL